MVRVSAFIAGERAGGRQVGACGDSSTTPRFPCSHWLLLLLLPAQCPPTLTRADRERSSSEPWHRPRRRPRVASTTSPTPRLEPHPLPAPPRRETGTHCISRYKSAHQASRRAASAQHDASGGRGDGEVRGPLGDVASFWTLSIAGRGSTRVRACGLSLITHGARRLAIGSSRARAARRSGIHFGEATRRDTDRTRAITKKQNSTLRFTTRTQRASHP